MKRFFAMFFTLTLAISLTGCGGLGQQRPAVSTMPSQIPSQPSAGPMEQITPPEEFVLINGGTFQMCSPGSEPWRSEDETAHTVTLSDFYISRYEVTQAEYQAVMREDPSSFTGDDLPVEGVSWTDAIQYCNARSTREGLTPAYAVDGLDRA